MPIISRLKAKLLSALKHKTLNEKEVFAKLGRFTKGDDFLIVQDNDYYSGYGLVKRYYIQHMGVDLGYVDLEIKRNCIIVAYVSVDEEFRDRGLSRKLMNFVGAFLDESKKFGWLSNEIHSFNKDTDVNAAKKSGLYERSGWTRIWPTKISFRRPKKSEHTKPHK